MSMNMPSMPSDLSFTPALPSLEGAGARIGLFDSGLGGLSVLKAVRARLPLADLYYVADSGHAPYGERSDDFIGQRAIEISGFLRSVPVDVVVVACNTATAAAVHTLRARWPDFPIIGVEPGLKPALAASANKRVGVMATPGTLASAKFRQLVHAHGQGAHIVMQACPGLAKEIESGQLDTPRLRELVSTFALPLRQAEVDTVVLGCTHYPLITPLFQAALGPGIRIIDTADAIAGRALSLYGQIRARRIDPAESSRPNDIGLTRLWTTGEPRYLAEVARNWLGLDLEPLMLP